MEVSAKAIELVAEEIKARGVSYDEIEEATLLSRSTISRVVKQRKASAYTVKQLVAYFEIGDKYRAIVGDEPELSNSSQLAADLMEELANVRTEWRQRLDEVKASAAERAQFFNDQLAMHQEERQREREMQERVYNRSTTHLKEQVIRLQRNNDLLVQQLLEAQREAKDASQRAVSAEAAAKEGSHSKTWIAILFGVIIMVMAVALLVALSTDRVL